MAKETQSKRENVAKTTSDGESYLGIELDPLPDEVMNNDGVTDEGEPRDPVTPAAEEDKPAGGDTTIDDEEFEGESDEIKALRKTAREHEEARKKAEAENADLRKGRVSEDILKLQNVKTQVDAAFTNTVATIDKLTNEIATLKAAKRKARDEGDDDQEEELDDKLATARMDLKQYEAVKSRIEIDQKKVDHHIKVVQEQAEVAKEEGASTQGLSVAAKAWVKDHPLYETDDEYRQVCLLGDASARKKNIPLDSREYFKHIEATLAKHYGEDQEEEDTMDEDKGKKTTTTTPPVKRPQSFGAPGRSGARGDSRKGQPYLTAEQKEMALISGFDDTPDSLREYWNDLPDNQKKRR